MARASAGSASDRPAGGLASSDARGSTSPTVNADALARALVDYGTEDRAIDSAESRCKPEDHVGRAPPLILKGYGRPLRVTRMRASC